MRRTALALAVALIATTAHAQTTKPRSLSEILFEPRLPYSPSDVVIHLRDENGGVIAAHGQRFDALAAAGHHVEIRGFCFSACTLITAYIPKNRLCFSEAAYLYFHSARVSHKGPPSPEANKLMFDAYPDDIRNWLIAKGGYENLPHEGYWVLRPHDLWKMGYRRCGT